MSRKRRRGLRGSPGEHAQHAESYLSLFPDTVARFDNAIQSGNCDRALDWFAEAHASIQAIAVSATHAGRREKALRARLQPFNTDLRRMRGVLKRTCIRKRR